MATVTDLEDGISQSTLSVRLEYNMEIGSRASRSVAQSFPVDWNVMPGVLDLRVVPSYDVRREDVGEGHYSEEEVHKEPDVWFEDQESAGMCKIEG